MDLARIKSEREILFDFLETVVTANEDQFQDLFGASAELGRAKQDFDSRMAVLAVLIADMLYFMEGEQESVVNFDIMQKLQKLSSRTSVDRFLQMAQFLSFIESSAKSYSKHE